MVWGRDFPGKGDSGSRLPLRLEKQIICVFSRWSRKSFLQSHDFWTGVKDFTEGKPVGPYQIPLSPRPANNGLIAVLLFPTPSLKTTFKIMPLNALQCHSRHLEWVLSPNYVPTASSGRSPSEGVACECSWSCHPFSEPSSSFPLASWVP